MSLTMAAGTLFLFQGNYQHDLAKAQTMSLTILAVFQWFNAWNCRSEGKSLLQMNPFSNMYLVAATIFVIFLQMLALYAPPFNAFLQTTPLNASDWSLILQIALSIIAVEEIRKFFYRHTTRN